MNRLARIIVWEVRPLIREGLSLLLESAGYEVENCSAPSDFDTKARAMEARHATDDRSDTVVLICRSRCAGLEAPDVEALRRLFPTAHFVHVDEDEHSDGSLQDEHKDSVLTGSISSDVLMRSLELIRLGECVHIWHRDGEDGEGPSTDTGLAVAASSHGPEPLVAGPATKLGGVEDASTCGTNGSSYEVAGAKVTACERCRDQEVVTSVATATTLPDRTRLRREALSPREVDILRCLIEGLSNKVIARRCDITESTVKVHLKAILRKIGVSNRTQAAVWALERLRAGDQPFEKVEENGHGPRHEDPSHTAPDATIGDEDDEDEERKDPDWNDIRKTAAVLAPAMARTVTDRRGDALAARAERVFSN